MVLRAPQVLHKKSAMAASSTAPNDAALPAERFLPHLAFTAHAHLDGHARSTGKLDIVTSFVAPLVCSVRYPLVAPTPR